MGGADVCRLVLEQSWPSPSSSRISCLQASCMPSDPFSRLRLYTASHILLLQRCLCLGEDARWQLQGFGRSRGLRQLPHRPQLRLPGTGRSSAYPVSACQPSWHEGDLYFTLISKSRCSL